MVFIFFLFFIRKQPFQNSNNFWRVPPLVSSIFQNSITSLNIFRFSEWSSMSLMDIPVYVYHVLLKGWGLAIWKCFSGGNITVVLYEYRFWLSDHLFSDQHFIQGQHTLFMIWGKAHINCHISFLIAISIVEAIFLQVCLFLSGFISFNL